MKKVPTFARTFSDNQRLTVFSNNRPLSLKELYKIQMLANWQELENEPREIANWRREFESRVSAALGLSKQGFPGMLDSFDFEILKMQGRVK